MAEIDQSLGEMARVDALAAHMGLAAVGQERDAQREIAVSSGASRGSGGICGGGHESTSLPAHPERVKMGSPSAAVAAGVGARVPVGPQPATN